MKLSLISIALALSSVMADKALVGYFPNWLYARYPVSNIDFTKYTHIHYAFATVVNSATPSWSDPAQTASQLPQLVSAAHAKKAKVLISLGGWSGGLAFSTIAASPSERATFIAWNVNQVSTYNIDGIDIDWEYPGRQGAGCNKVDVVNDANNFLTLLKELRAALDSKFGAGKKEISIATRITPFDTPSGPMKDVSAFAKVIDRFNVMTYDVNGAWANTTGPNAPFNYEAGHGLATSYVAGIQAWLKAGVPANKLVAGLAFYGRATTATVDMTKTKSQYQSQRAGVVPSADRYDGYWQDASCPSTPGGFSGVWRYGNLRSQGVLTSPTTAAAPWVRYWDNVSKTPWLFNTNTKMFVSYDDPSSLQVKVDYALCQNLGGVMVWSVDEDTSNGELVSVANHIRTSSKPSVCPQ
ncbi:glycoside hydrolase superfamily [Spinellus fusiger]|nr:glycoside hydrolase superfamily [Spinellus fusiger]